MSKIYTKTGDAGETSLLGGERVTKDCITMQVVGELDELNAALGVTLSVIPSEVDGSLVVLLRKIQSDLFRVGAEVAVVQFVIPAKAGIQGDMIGRLDPHLREDDIIGKLEISELEQSIDEMSAALPKLKNFILPGGAAAAAYLHLARAICRRVERALVAFGKKQKLRPELYQYLNRLSDWLFTAARYVNFKLGIKESKV